MFGSLKRRLRAAASALLRPQFDHFDTRIDNIETALHRDVFELRASIEERAFIISELVVRTGLSELQASTRQRTEAAAEQSVRLARASTPRRRRLRRRLRQSPLLMSTRKPRWLPRLSSRSGCREHTEAALEAASLEWNQRIAGLRTELGRTQRAVERNERTPAATADGAMNAVSPANPEVDDLLYLAIEDRFRGDPVEIRTRQERYLPYLPDVIEEAYPLLDLGVRPG